MYADYIEVSKESSPHIFTSLSVFTIAQMALRESNKAGEKRKMKRGA